MAIHKYKIAVIGAGHLGKIHLKCILASEHFELIGFHDVDEEQADEVAKKFNVTHFSDREALIAAAEIVDIVTPTPYHFEVAKFALEKGKHLFIEKPVTSTPDQAKELMQMAKAKQLVIQVGHVERFNPAFLALKDIPLKPVFIEAHRLANFNPRGTDVSVVLDLMIHDLDLILSLIKSPLESIHASGVALVSHSADICNARLAFENGCVVNLTASRISLKQMRKLRIFQPDAYLSLDFLEKETQIVRLHNEEDLEEAKKESLLELDTAKGKKFIEIVAPDIQPSNAIQMELESLAMAITNGSAATVTIEDGMQALHVAHKILDQIEKSADRVRQAEL